jgi:glycosyltransferase involved in cell wall biosynthesis
MKNAKTIIFLSEMPITNGVIQAQLLPVVLAASKKGYFVHLVETTGRFDSQENVRTTTEEKLKSAGIHLEKIKIPRHTFLPSILYFSIKSNALIKKIAKNNPKGSVLIYARNYKFCPALILNNTLRKIPFIYSPRGAYVAERMYYKKIKDILYGGLIGYLEKKSIKRSAAAIAETENFKKHLEEIYQLKEDKIHVVSNYYNVSLVPPTDWNREEMRQKLGYTNKKVIVYAGTIEVWYDFEKMFDLVAKLKKKDPRIFFQLFAKEDYARDESEGLFQKLKSIAKKYGLSENTDYSISSYSPEERYRHLSACDAGICLTTPEEFKTIMLYLKIVDYLGAGLPIIVNSEVASAVEIIKSSGIGAVVDYQNWDSSISKIDIDSIFGKTGANSAEYKKFSSSSIIPAYLDLFDSIFARLDSRR